MNIFIYRHMRTNDPCRHGVWGIRDCMRSYRKCSYDAVLGIGGLTAKCRAMRKRITWIGIGVHRQEAPGKKGPLVTFDHVCLMNENGPMLFDVAPFLYDYVNEHNHRARIPLFVPVQGSDPNSLDTNF